MFATAIRLSKASRRPLTSKKANKDFYKGTGQARLPGGHRTGAPGVHVIGGKAKYRLIDEQVRVFIAPPISEIESSPLRPYVSTQTRLTKTEEQQVFGKLPSQGLTAAHFLSLIRSNGTTVLQESNQE